VEVKFAPEVKAQEVKVEIKEEPKPKFD